MAESIEELLKSKPITGGFAVIAFIGGVIFLSYSYSLTGNVVLNNKYSFNLLSLIGLLLVVCSGILSLYSIKKKK